VTNAVGTAEEQRDGRETETQREREREKESQRERRV
jgi:hypothetical protein